jgi:hypothetical protein
VKIGIDENQNVVDIENNMFTSLSQLFCKSQGLMNKNKWGICGHSETTIYFTNTILDSEVLILLKHD